MSHITISTQSDYDHSEQVKMARIGSRVRHMSSGRQLWLVTRSQSAGRLTPA